MAEPPPERSATKKQKVVHDAETPQRRLFKCGDCNSSYSRIDHLQRHVKIHTQDRPHACETCGKSFTRADMLRRHMVIHDPTRREQRKTAVPLTGGKPHSRCGAACTACAVMHLRCEDEKPCARCKSKGLVCAQSDVASGAGLQDTSRDHSLELPQPFCLEDPIADNDTIPTLDGVANTNVFNGQQRNSNSPSGAVRNLDTMPMLNDQNHALSGPPVAVPWTDRHEAYACLSRGSMNSPGVRGHDLASTHLTGTRTPRGLFDFGADTDLAFDDMDLAFLSQWNQNDPFHIETPPTQDTLINAPASTRTSESGRTPTGKNLSATDVVGKPSVWRFQPTSADNNYNNLALPGTKQSGKLPDYRRLTAEPLSAITRDEILWMMMQARPDARSLLSFPTAGLLDSLLQYCLSSKTGPTTFIHIPTFDPSQKRAALCAALAAAGAMMVPDMTMHKLGLAMQEAVRLGLTDQIEKDNSLIRDLECLQSLLISLDIGLWSGNSRKLELAESFLQPYATMVRRCCWFRWKYEDIIVTAEDIGQVLEEKWRQWVELETRKRMVYWLFEHDATMSIALSVNMNMSYAELALPLPSSQRLWVASTAERWKDLYLTGRHQNPSISLVDLLQNVELVVDDRERLDDKMAVRALLSAAWGMIRPYKQLASISRSQSNAWNNGLLLSSRLAELTQLLACVDMGLSEPRDRRSTILLETLSMHLHVSLDDVHLLAGFDGRGEAERIYPALREWVDTCGARQSIWHAGQVLRYAKDLGPIQEFHAVAVYQASLALWSYSVVRNSMDLSFSLSTDRTMNPDHDSVFVHLDRAETPASKAFIKFNRGRPAVSTLHRDPRSLAATADVLKASISILQARHDSQQARPLLVENLTGLLEGLIEMKV